MYELRHYHSPDGQDLFGRWLDGLTDRQAKARVAARLIRLNNGNFGDCKPVGDGVWELRIDWGPGYRVYYAIEGERVVLLCEGGDKRTQTADVQRAIARWNEWQQRGKTMNTTGKHDEWLFEQLKDAEFAAEYLNAAGEDEDPSSYLTALRKVVEARGGVAAVAQKAHLSRESLYRTLSIRGNPTIRTLNAVLKATGLKLGVYAH